MGGGTRKRWPTIRLVHRRMQAPDAWRVAAAIILWDCKLAVRIATANFSLAALACADFVSFARWDHRAVSLKVINRETASVDSTARVFCPNASPLKPGPDAIFTLVVSRLISLNQSDGRRFVTIPGNHPSYAFTNPQRCTGRRALIGLL